MPHQSPRPQRERDLLAQQPGTHTLEELYASVYATAPETVTRDAGTEIVHSATDARWKRRVRGALQTLKRQGRAHRAAPGIWVIDGPPHAPRRAVLVTTDGPLDQLELRLADATDLLSALPGPADLILTDPPYGLGVGQGARHDTGQRTYARDHTTVLPGYRDVPAAAYREFTTTWVTAAAAALRPGGHLAVITGPQQAAWVQVACEDAGLNYLNSIAVGKVFPLRTTRKFSHSHFRVTLVCSGPPRSARRVFTPPPDLPRARSGRDYPLDLWPAGSVGRVCAAPGAVRYPNTLPLRLVDRLMGALTRPVETTAVPDLVCDPFLGGGTTAVAALQRGLRFSGGDLNPAALTFTLARLSGLLLEPARQGPAPA